MGSAPFKGETNSARRPLHGHFFGALQRRDKLCQSPDGNTTHDTPFSSPQAIVNQHPVDTLGPVDHLKPEDFWLDLKPGFFWLASNQMLFVHASNQRSCTLTLFITPTACVVQKLEPFAPAA